ncbi:carbon-nitrogen hydrolase family protein [Streptomyces sp. NPDC020801]|uniref:carbon-nitrogen hydrolase family protein n=1 Tax=unclassified Streptomyces TaxID=2593676 RepID=UPI00378B62D5
MRAFTAAAIQLVPAPGPLTTAVVKDNVERAAQWVTRCVQSTGAELVVLPESVTTGFTPALPPEELWDLVDELSSGALCEPLRDRARELGIHLVWGAYGRGDERGVVYNSAVLAGPDGQVLGVYHKTHPFGPELRDRGGWVTPGDRVTVVDTDLGRIGMIICFDGDFPELSRVQAVRGAEILCRPSALLRSVDLWELTCRARAYDNHVYVIGANATGADPAGVLYFGNSMIVTPGAEVVARGSSHESWVSARLDPSRALAALTPGSNVPQVFDHLRDRNLALLRHYADDLTAAAQTPFPRGSA